MQVNVYCCLPFHNNIWPPYIGAEPLDSYRASTNHCCNHIYLYMLHLLCSPFSGGIAAVKLWQRNAFLTAAIEKSIKDVIRDRKQLPQLKAKRWDTAACLMPLSQLQWPEIHTGMSMLCRSHVFSRTLATEFSPLFLPPEMRFLQ